MSFTQTRLGPGNKGLGTRLATTSQQPWQQLSHQLPAFAWCIHMLASYTTHRYYLGATFIFPMLPCVYTCKCTYLRGNSWEEVTELLHFIFCFRLCTSGGVRRQEWNTKLCQLSSHLHVFTSDYKQLVVQPLYVHTHYIPQFCCCR